MQTIAHVESPTRAMDHRMDIDESQETTIRIHYKVAELTHESRLRRRMGGAAIWPPKAVERRRWQQGGFESAVAKHGVP